ncbi:hypothetical protein MD484_g6185, partial [Candolleomyces efflorescens]
MTRQFVNNRRAFYGFVVLLSGGFIIFALIVASLNILVFLLSANSLWSQPRFEIFSLLFFGILWLVVAAWATDIVGDTHCYNFEGTLNNADGNLISSSSSCKQLKVVQAFSWALFVTHIIALHVLFKLIGHAKRLGRYDISYAPIREVPWFYEMPGYYPTKERWGRYSGGGYPQYPMPSAQGQPVVMQSSLPVNGAVQQPQVTHITV